jgi:hypothetical protein
VRECWWPGAGSHRFHHTDRIRPTLPPTPTHHALTKCGLALPTLRDQPRVDHLPNQTVVSHRGKTPPKATSPHTTSLALTGPPANQIKNCTSKKNRTWFDDPTVHGMEAVNRAKPYTYTCKPNTWSSSFVAISQHHLPAQNERDNEELITHVARQPGGPLGSCKCSYARDHGLGAMLVRRSLRAVWYSLELLLVLQDPTTSYSYRVGW